MLDIPNQVDQSSYGYRRHALGLGSEIASNASKEASLALLFLDALAPPTDHRRVFDCGTVTIPNYFARNCLLGMLHHVCDRGLRSTGPLSKRQRLLPPLSFASIAYRAD